MIREGRRTCTSPAARYLVLHDLEVDGREDNGINCDDGGAYADPEATRHVIFRGLDDARHRTGAATTTA